MLKPPRRAVEIRSAKSAVAGYGYIVGIGPNDGLNVGIDVSDIATVVDILSADAANTDNVAGCGASLTS